MNRTRLTADNAAAAQRRERTTPLRIGATLRGRAARCIAALWLAAGTVVLAAPPDPAAHDRHPGADGLRIYRDGRLPDGEHLIGLGAGSATVRTPCAGCHRDSGMGGGEGNQRVVPITAADLFEAPAELARPAAGDRLPRARPGATVQPGRRLSRPGYDLTTLASALRTGIDAAGRPLDPLMPRYPHLDDAAVQALAAHLATLRTDAAPGWIQPGPDAVQGELHLATIVTPDAPPQRVRALLSTLQAWQSQHQSPRVRLRPVMQVWRLEGPPADWPAQLADRQTRQPVFAVLSGAAGAPGSSPESWRPVQEWCEREALPCLLPLVDTPPETPAPSNAPRWTLHGSAGSRTEAQALAVLLRQSPASARLRQWFDDATGQRAASLLQTTLAHDEDRDDEPDHEDDHGGHGGHDGHDDNRQAESVDARSALARWCALGEADTLVIWSGPAVLSVLDRALEPGQDLPADCTGPGRVYLSASQLGHRPPQASAWVQRARLVSTEVDDQRLHARTAIALQPWARRTGLDLFDEREQAKVHAATSWFTEALARMQGRVGRDYLMESLERTLDNRALAGPWLSVSLGPGQRVAVKSAQILHLDGPAAARRWRAEGQPIRP